MDFFSFVSIGLIRIMFSCFKGFLSGEGFFHLEQLLIAETFIEVTLEKFATTDFNCGREISHLS